MWDLLLTHCNAATMSPGTAPYGPIADAAIGIAGDRIAGAGPRANLPGKTFDLARNVRDLGGCWVTPGLIDCHTHLVFAGNRAEEFEARLKGATYEEIAKAGGGIATTVKATRTASVDDLVAQSLPRLRDLMAEGVTTVEIKSGYGLEPESEYRMLAAAGRLGESARVRVVRTFLGAHTIPPEHRASRADYVEALCARMIPEVAAARLAEAVDVYCETIAFTREETRTIFEAARKAGLRVKIHAGQLSDMRGAELVAEFGALSADHLEHLSEAGAAAMAKAATVAVLLPGAFYFLRETHAPPVDLLRKAGVAIAIATDCNPGTSPVTSPLLILNLAATLFRLTPEEALTAMTRNAAKALGRAGEIGEIATDLAADLAVWDIAHPAELCYWLGRNPLRARVFGGAWEDAAPQA
ncbi:MAG: imidazolonepropionase [Alphaproteobacteria bacterium]